MDHMLIIPDGDRRYATQKGISKTDAYEKAAGIVRNLARWVLVDNDVKELTFFGLSYSNVIKRANEDLAPILEVQTEALNSYVEDDFFKQNEIKISVYGQMEVLPKEYVKAVIKAEKATSKFSKRHFNLLLGYSGQLDMEQAIAKAAKDDKKPTMDNIISRCQLHKPIDFVIRTANESRMSDGPFFLIRYAEFHSVPAYFPDLSKEDIDNSIKVYDSRRRTFGI